MDDFGVLVKNYGIKPQGKSAPMAASKGSTRTTHNYSSPTNLDPFSTSKPYSNSSSEIGSFLDHQNDPFGFSFTHKPLNSGATTRLDFDFNSSLNLNPKSSDVNDDVIWGFSGTTNGVGKGNGNGNDLLSSDPVDDFLGSLGNLGLNKGKKLDENKGFSFDNDELLPGFGRSNGSNDRAQASSTEKSAGLSSLEELEDFATVKVKKNVGVRLDPPKIKNEMKKTNQQQSQEANFFDMEGSVNGGSVNQKKVEGSSFSSVDELEDFATFKTKKNANVHLDASKFKNEKKKTFERKPQETNFFDVEGSVDGVNVHQMKVDIDSVNMFQEQAPDLDSFFGAHTRKSVPVPENASKSGKTEEVPDLFFGATFSKQTNIQPGSFADDLFGGPPTSGQFEEIEGESEDRRRARLERYRRTETRIGQVLANMKQNEFKAQQEQEERHRIAESLDVEIKRWAAGKEGNLRALLSSLQQVLGPEFNWRPVTLTDLITSSQVKVAYKKAALCVHPDKVQQRGASLQQKYVAEKVFDLLKEACNKFNSEELR